jgi:hypothetical protein
MLHPSLVHSLENGAALFGGGMFGFDRKPPGNVPNPESKCSYDVHSPE